MILCKTFYVTLGFIAVKSFSITFGAIAIGLVLGYLTTVALILGFIIVKNTEKFEKECAEDLEH